MRRFLFLLALLPFPALSQTIRIDATHDLPYSPAHPNCSNSWGTYRMFTVDANYQIGQKVSQYFAAQMITQEWVQPNDAEHLLFRASSDVRDAQGNVLLTAYPVLRPDGDWSLLVVNKDYDSAHAVRIAFHDADAENDDAFAGPIAMITFGKDQYQWHPARNQGHADPDDPPSKSTVQAGPGTVFTLPAASMTVLRGKTAAVSAPARGPATAAQQASIRPGFYFFLLGSSSGLM